jgi:hypothetical protein
MLSREQKADLVAFLRSLTDESLLHDPRFANPGANSRKADRLVDGACRYSSVIVGATVVKMVGR